MINAMKKVLTQVKLYFSYLNKKKNYNKKIIIKKIVLINMP